MKVKGNAKWYKSGWWLKCISWLLEFLVQRVKLNHLLFHLFDPKASSGINAEYGGSGGGGGGSGGGAGGGEILSRLGGLVGTGVANLYEMYEMIDEDLGLDFILQDIHPIVDQDQNLETEDVLWVEEMEKKMIQFHTLDEEFQQPTYTLQPPTTFVPFSIPFNLHGNTWSNPVPLPQPYQSSLLNNTRAFGALSKLLSSVADPNEVTIHSYIHKKFQEWLQSTGKLEEMEQLVKLHVKTMTPIPPNQKQHILTPTLQTV
eukprot:TRINITY_DN6909_c0_g1_i5.p1 TRINITY_DN6909_c0_g1~~TRINITY_DN6909_c0_g1_i5.p1  ORF type:complete len:259 (+),score=74.08 TRINITY_DN6909_c0_g1_i5:365-1141(+)